MDHKGRSEYSSLFDGPVLMQSWATREGGSTAVCLMALSWCSHGPQGKEGLQQSV